MAKPCVSNHRFLGLHRHEENFERNESNERSFKIKKIVIHSIVEFCLAIFKLMFKTLFANLINFIQYNVKWLKLFKKVATLVLINCKVVDKRQENIHHQCL